MKEKSPHEKAREANEEILKLIRARNWAPVSLEILGWADGVMMIDHEGIDHSLLGLAKYLEADPEFIELLENDAAFPDTKKLKKDIATKAKRLELNVELVNAALINDIDAVERCIIDGADVRYKISLDCREVDAMYFAARFKNAKMIELLVWGGATLSNAAREALKPTPEMER